MSTVKPSQNPPSKLGVYRVLCPKVGVRLSPLALGGAAIGDKMNDKTGKQDKEGSFALLDAYFDNGGNFIDTANG
jgi:aryl-alcohol dehydrogenase-like predicted oxidoreductase